MALTRTGIYVVPMLIFRPFCRPLLLPWPGIKRATTVSVLFYFRQTRVEFADREGRLMTLLLPLEAWVAIREISGRPEIAVPAAGS